MSNQNSLCHIGLRSKWVAFLCVGLFASQIAFAQDYQVDPINPEYVLPEIDEDTASKTEKSAWRRQVSEINKVIKGDKKIAEDGLAGRGNVNQATIDKYLKGYAFPKMTQTDDDTLSSLGKIRSDFIDDFLSDKVNGGGRQFVIDLTLPAMQKIWEGENYHPAVRLNAALLVGMINDVEPARGQDPSPSLQAVNSLIAVMRSEDLPEFVKVGAMTGLHRNALFDAKMQRSKLDDATKQQMNAIASSILDKSSPGQANWAPEVDYWLSRRAIQVMGYLKNSAGNNSDKLLALIGNADQLPEIRMEAMLAIQNIPLNQAATDQAIETITTYLSTALGAVQKEVEAEFAELVAINLLYGDKDLLQTGVAPRGRNEQQRGSAAGAGQNEGNAGGRDEEEEKKPKIELPNYQLNRIRRHIQAICTQGKATLSKLRASASDEKKQLVTKANDLLTDLIAESDVGIIDHNEKKKEMDDEPNFGDPNKDLAPPKAVADQMSELCTSTAKDLQNLINPVGDVEAIIGSN